jgi:hypothetical protein
MKVKVLVDSTNTNRISINGQKRTTVRTVGVSALGQRAVLSELDDVDASSPNSGEVLVYDAALQLYVIKTLPALDGGFY